jgi:hypothetical protein
MDASEEVIEKSGQGISPLTVPIPYYPAIKPECGTAFATVMLIYLETHYPAPQDSSHQKFQRVTSLPVRLDSERMCAELQVARRTLVLTLSILSTWFSGEAQRSRAHGASREFIKQNDERFRKDKFYSLTGPRNYRYPQTWILRRNIPLISATLRNANILNAITCAPLTTANVQSNIDAGKRVLTVNDMPGSAQIVAALERANVLAGDRRKVRYSRLKAGIEHGLVPESVIKRMVEKSVSSRDDNASDEE